ncbi:Calcitonin receptor, partial [Pseudolycoriella hygida]
NWCIMLHLVIHYLMLANYFWMFCEGLHLHLVLVVVFVKDSVAMRWFIFIGWFAPIILILIYGFVREYSSSYNTHCWMDDSSSMWILKVPVLISLLASIVFLVNVVRVLCNKLHPGTAQLAPMALQKALRATLILVPLFGLHYILLPFRPEAGGSLDKIYQITSAALISLQ